MLVVTLPMDLTNLSWCSLTQLNPGVITLPNFKMTFVAATDVYAGKYSSFSKPHQEERSKP